VDSEITYMTKPLAEVVCLKLSSQSCHATSRARVVTSGILEHCSHGVLCVLRSSKLMAAPFDGDPTVKLVRGCDEVTRSV
jgi:hypothetical protein